jgi:hypothetical protein
VPDFIPCGLPPACHTGAGINSRVPARRYLRGPRCARGLSRAAQKRKVVTSPVAGSPSNAWNVNFNNGNTNNNDMTNTNDVRCVR